jgi:hypothetical protein
MNNIYNCNFCIFEKSQGEYNKLEHQFFSLFKLHCLQSFNFPNLMHIDPNSRILICTFKTIVNNVFFFKYLFSWSNVHHSFSKLERILKLVKFIFKLALTNMFLNLTIMNFGTLFLTKVIHLNSPLGTKVSILGNPIDIFQACINFIIWFQGFLSPYRGGWTWVYVDVLLKTIRHLDIIVHNNPFVHLVYFLWLKHVDKVMPF